MQYMSFAPAGSVHSKASAIFLRAILSFANIPNVIGNASARPAKNTHEPLPFHTYILSSLATKLHWAYAKSPHTRQKKTFAMT